ncbi:UNVERIFIED_ORG: CheY-like chemotaxis protein [Arthrobacter globiformis]|nr:CheY-like chemotaxis protein [Arthrobacter globiformis]
MPVQPSEVVASLTEERFPGIGNGAPTRVARRIIAAGITAWRSRPTRNPGVLLCIAGWLWLASGIRRSSDPVAFTLGITLTLMYQPPLLQLALSFPFGVLRSRTEKAGVVERSGADVAVVDIRMPPTYTIEGIQAAEALKSKHPELGVLLLSQYVETENAMFLLKNGAKGLGYLLKERVSDVEIH